MEHSQALAANLRAELARQRISGRELSRLLGENVSWTHRRLAGAQEITVDDLYRIAQVLHVPVGVLLGEAA
jgi:transcriptional regulator with XRE-family HTH domain